MDPQATNLSLNQADLSDLDSRPPQVHGTAEPYQNTNGGNNFSQQAVNTKDALLNSAQSAMSAVNNHPTTQNIKDTVYNGPVGQNVKAEAGKTRDEFADLANARSPPKEPAATGQPLTAYHSLFYRLLSWKNPRATAISFALSVIFIFSARYLNIFRYVLKAIYMTLGITASAEFLGKAALGNGLTSQVRPRKYFTIPKASLERLLDDVEQLINFFVIESQRIVFAENLYATAAAFLASLISYFLIKFVPFWGLALIATSVAYLGPLVYIQNKEVIDHHLKRASTVASQQATQIRDMAAQQTGNAVNTIQTYAGEYTHKAQDTINQYRGRSASPDVAKKGGVSSGVSHSDKGPAFPAVPKETPAFPAAPKHEPNVVDSNVVVSDPSSGAPAVQKVPVVEPAL
jgi:ABC-type multidrug transport system fused ATPase/permease subunit